MYKSIMAAYSCHNLFQYFRIFQVPINIVFFSTLFWQSVLCDDHVILTPTDPSSQPCVVVIFPDEGEQKDSYVGLGTDLLSQTRYSVWVVLVDYKNYQPLLNRNIPSIMNDVMSQLMTSYNIQEPISVFVVSHGSSALPVQDYVDVNPDKTSGLILFGTEVRKGPLLPVPVMLISAELDTTFRVSRIAFIFKKMFDMSGKDITSMMNTPIIVIPNASRNYFIEGAPKLLGDPDFTTQTRPSISRQRAAAAMMSFVLHILRLPEKGNSPERLIYKELLQTQALLKPFTDLQTMTFNKEKRSSEWVRHAQMWISGVPRAITQSLRVEGLRTLGDGDFKPLMYDMESSWKIFAWIKLVRAGTGSAAQVQAPEAIKARLIDAERIHHDLGIIDLFNSSSVRTCKDINYASYMTAYHTASREARHRYDNKNPGIIFDDDYQVYSEKDWNNANLVVAKRGRVYHVRASSLKRKFTVEDSTDGTIYCTLLPPDRALEWIYIDSLVT